MNTQELLEKLHGLFENLTAEHSKGSKAAQGRARKTAGEIKKVAKSFVNSKLVI
jgi:hypothetical protein